MRVFWPADAIKSDKPGVLIGWRNSETDLLIAAVLHDAQPRSVENALRVGTLYRDSPHPVTKILHLCGPAPLQILGLVNPKDATATPLSPHQIVAYTQPSTRYPSIVSSSYVAVAVQIVIFERPQTSKMQYMSLEPMALAIDDKTDRAGLIAPPFEAIDAAEKKEERRKEDLVEKLKLHTVIRYPATQMELNLPTIIQQINCSYDVNNLLQKNVGLVRPRPRRTLSVSERVVESATDLWDYTQLAFWYAFNEWIYPVVTKVFIYGLMAHRMAGELIVLAADHRFGPRQIALRDISATAQQVDLRLQQFCYWPFQYFTLRDSKNDWDSVTSNHPEYIRFYNSLWLVANDVIMGIAIGSFIIENADAVAHRVDKLIIDWSLDGLRRIISWLMVYPAGLKLNKDLADFLGDLFLWVIDYWSGCVTLFQPFFPNIIRFTGFASFAGASMPLSLASDIVSLITLHIYCFYVAAARIYGWQLNIIISLFHLFRGNKRNVLRNRIDSCDYELDQLLLGTILFTLLTFLLPTVVVFYFTFACARMGIITTKAILDTMLACLNHFPLFALMLRFKDPRRLPGTMTLTAHTLWRMLTL
ncbi:MAG: phosphatidylinositol N-acetylglucosaminyltransferase subunit gpi1 [Chrysothrix sp. TS-e1954]|nr:MAG: phosphatidylinositol N-acetylglucosaminyltransferase subunit gpi1 [Chrysothrix sp. TS-e1954]